MNLQHSHLLTSKVRLNVENEKFLETRSKCGRTLLYLTLFQTTWVSNKQIILKQKPKSKMLIYYMVTVDYFNNLKRVLHTVLLQVQFGLVGLVFILLRLFWIDFISFQFHDLKFRVSQVQYLSIIASFDLGASLS